MSERAVPGNGPGGGPRVPRPRPSRLVQVYAAFGVLVLLLYFTAGLLGWSVEQEDRDALPPSVRHAPGGYRSYHLWHSGFQGGK